MEPAVPRKSHVILLLSIIIPYGTCPSLSYPWGGSRCRQRKSRWKGKYTENVDNVCLLPNIHIIIILTEAFMNNIFNEECQDYQTIRWDGKNKKIIIGESKKLIRVRLTKEDTIPIEKRFAINNKLKRLPSWENNSLKKWLIWTINNVGCVKGCRETQGEPTGCKDEPHGLQGWSGMTSEA